MADPSIRTPNLPLRSDITEILGHALVGGTKTLARGNLATIFAAPMAVFAAPGALNSDWYGKIAVVDQVSAAVVTLPRNATPGAAVTFFVAGLGLPSFAQETGLALSNRSGHTGAAGQFALVTLLCYQNTDGNSAKWALGGDTA